MHDTDDLQTASSILRLGKVRHQLSWVRLASSQAHRTSPTFGVLGDQETPMRKKKTSLREWPFSQWSHWSGVSFVRWMVLVKSLIQHSPRHVGKMIFLAIPHTIVCPCNGPGYDHFAAIPTQLFWSWSDTESISLFMFNVNTHNNMLEQ